MGWRQYGVWLIFRTTSGNSPCSLRFEIAVSTMSSSVPIISRHLISCSSWKYLSHSVTAFLPVLYVSFFTKQEKYEQIERKNSSFVDQMIFETNLEKLRTYVYVIRAYFLIFHAISLMFLFTNTCTMFSSDAHDHWNFLQINAIS